MNDQEKTDVLRQVSTSGVYPESKALYKLVKDVDVRIAITKRWINGLERRPVLRTNDPSASYWRIMIDQGLNITILFARTDPFGCTFWSQTVPDDILCEGGVWEDLREHETKQTQPEILSNDRYLPPTACGAFLGPNTR